MLKVIILIIVTICLFLFINNLVFVDQLEGYNGALLQLVAKGPQDTYLTGDAWKYIPPYYYGLGGYPWYNATRLGKYYGYYYPKYTLIKNNPRLNWYNPWGNIYY